jgi:hypothetical protein
VTGSDGETQARVEETSATAATRVLADLVNDGPSRVRFTDTSADGRDWIAGGGSAGRFEIAPDGQVASSVTLTPGGDLRAGGALLQNADPTDGENAVEVDGAATLQALRTPEISSREYASDPTDARHVWPSAQDFRTAFGLGTADDDVSPGDMAGVALASIKALAKRLARLERVRRPAATGSGGGGGG